MCTEPKCWRASVLLMQDVEASDGVVSTDTSTTIAATRMRSLRLRLYTDVAPAYKDMAATSAFTKRAYEAQLAHIYRIQNKQIRDIVLEFVFNPKRTASYQAPR